MRGPVHSDPIQWLYDLCNEVTERLALGQQREGDPALLTNLLNTIDFIEEQEKRCEGLSHLADIRLRRASRLRSRLTALRAAINECTHAWRTNSGMMGAMTDMIRVLDRDGRSGK